ncbi:MAG: terminase gpA endonuclease subunit, partial [Sneathiella sp.]
SFWMFGVVAALSSWEELVRNFLTAQEELERSGKEDPLKTVINVDLAEPYIPKALQEVKTLNAEVLRDRAKKETYKLGTVPDGVRFLIATVDTQGNRFEVKVEGWGEWGENWTIDYFQIFKPEKGDRMLDPTQFAEDWDLLIGRVALKVYPLADGSDRGMPILITGIDMHGAAGASDQAYSFWRRAKAKGFRNKIRLLRGDPKLKHERWRETYPDSQRKDRKAISRGEVPVIGLNSNTLKNEVFVSLLKAEVGPGYRHHPKELIEDKILNYFDQLTAEELVDGIWKKIRARNEATDLSYYSRGLWLFKKCDRIKWDETVPAFAKPWDENPTLIPLKQGATGDQLAGPPKERRKLSSLLA